MTLEGFNIINYNMKIIAYIINLFYCCDFEDYGYDLYYSL